MLSKDWKSGDKVVHAGRPEWGVGQVTLSEPVVQDGRKAQRLTVRFERAGMKTLSTAFADLRPADQMPSLEREVRESGMGLLGLEATEVTGEVMARLPEAATDPFRGYKSRLAATLELFRFSPSGASLLDWACMQTGLKDPLSKFNRHELEQFFEKFQTARETHLRRLVQDMRKQDPQALADATAAATPAMRQVLRRADTGR
jgi:hypothetical protein